MLPFIIALGAIIDYEYIIYALFSTAVTGALQVGIATVALIIDYRNKLLYIYFVVTASFFVIWFFNIADNIIWLLPPMLAVYLTVVLIYLNQRNTA